MNASIIFTTIIFSLMIRLSYTSISRSNAEIQCIQVNTYWDSILSTDNNIKDPTSCHKISDSCCYIHIKYRYNDITPFENSYCFTMTGKKDSWIDKFTNLYKDELMWYANFTYNNFEIYESIGNNLNYAFYANYTCIETHPYEDYSTYNITQCALFNDDYTCLIKNDENNFQNFVEDLYRIVTKDKCGGYQFEDGCVNYNNEGLNTFKMNGLVENLKIALDVDNNEEEEILDSDMGGNKNFKWNLPCKPVPLVTVSIECPAGYSISTYFKINYFILYFVLIFLIYV